MRQCAAQALAWSREQGQGWTRDTKTIAAVAHMVAQIGELSRRVSMGVKRTHPDIPWAAISGMRNRIYHNYGALDAAVLAETVRKDLPALARQLDAILGADS
jgi:uncharacterized protein with HEPN domain